MDKDLQKKVKQIDIRLRRKVNSLFSGAYRSSMKGQGMLFSHVREYVSGDDIRSMAWSLTAKKSKPYVKVFEEDKHSQMFLVLDASSSMNFGVGKYSKKTVVENLSSLLAFCALKNKDSLGLLIFSSDIDLYLKPKKGKTHVFRMIREICDLKNKKSQQTDINKALLFLYKTLRERTQIFIFSDFLNSTPFEKSLGLLENKHEVASILVSDLFEQNIPPLGLIDFEDLETGKQRSIDLFFGNKQLKKRLERNRKERERQFKKSRSDRLFIKSQEDIYQPLISFFKKRAILSS